MRRAARWSYALVAGALASCSPGGIVGEGELPPDVRDPEQFHTPQGAVAVYQGALVQFRNTVGGLAQTVDFGIGSAFIVQSGLLSDELTMLAMPTGLYGPSGTTYADSRTLPEIADPAVERSLGNDKRLTYANLQKVRGQAQEAIGLLRAYAPAVSPALSGHLYAVQGYAEVFLADLYCSGIPLSTVEFDADYTYQPGSSTEAVYAHAIALFDSAAALAADSADIATFAALGKGRALLALGRFAEAAAAVAAVPDRYEYQLQFAAEGEALNFIADMSVNRNRPTGLSMGDREGGTGLDYVSSGDPRTPAATGGRSFYGHTQSLPAKYLADGSGAIPIASGLEARLLEAEAALQGRDTLTWLGKLNHLRQTAVSPALPDLADPGTDAAGTDASRVDLTFRERAFWLYLTGHRQGDLRRLIRQYDRDPDTVYPTGEYRGGTGAYGSDVTLPVPAAERAYNPKYTGCLGRGA